MFVQPRCAEVREHLSRAAQAAGRVRTVYRVGMHTPPTAGAVELAALSEIHESNQNG